MAADLREGLRWVAVPTPLGELSVLVSDLGVRATAFDEGPDPAILGLEREWGPAQHAPSALDHVVAEVTAYFEGRLRAFSIPPDLSTFPEGFGRRVLEITAAIPFGELWTYGDVAGMSGSPRGGRAAGNALNRCPIELFVPCHRVVHAGGSLGGYGRHEERKRWLIHHERKA